MKDKPIAAGKSSFELIDPLKVFDGLRLRGDSTFLDIACGFGKYSIAATERMGARGKVYALDLWEEGIAVLTDQISKREIKNIKALVADATRHIPLKDGGVDICLMATVLHDFIRINEADGVLNEIKRVLKPQGELAVIEFKKMDGPPGPPIQIRISSEDVEGIVAPYGFRKEGLFDVGPYNYLIMFSTGKVG